MLELKKKGSVVNGTGYHHLENSGPLIPVKVNSHMDPMHMDMDGGPQGKKKRRSLCVGCGGSIQDQFILRVAPDLEWHATCLKCAECSEYLDESCTCFVRGGRTYCKRDYVRLFGVKCTKCSQSFSKNDFVMRARNKVFHIDCFRCVACSRQLIPGDEFALRDDGLFCKADNDIVERSVNNNNSPSGENLEDSKDNVVVTDSKSGDDSPEGASPKNGSTNGSDGAHPHPRKKGHKTTRVRTVLNEKQLHTLRTCYNANPRPDALMKEQLTEMTALSPRVIRVWFQNKRCKDKKRSIYLKQMQQQQQEKQGVPMVASSPVRHEPPPNMQGGPVDVQSYQAPWKALSEFAMGPGGPHDHMDHGQAPFQQLMSQFDDPDSIAMNGLPGHHMQHPHPHPCGPGDFGGPHPPHQMGGYGLGHMDDFHQPNSVDSDATHADTASDRYSPQSH